MAAPIDVNGTGFFFHFGAYTGLVPSAFYDNITTAFRARTFVAQGTDAATQFKLGLAFNATTASGQTDDLTIGESYLVVVKYQYVAGDLNDEVSLFVFEQGDDISDEPATPTLGPFLGTQADAPALQAACLRQYDFNPNIVIDGLFVKNGWDIETCLPTTGTDTRTECTSYTWIDGNTYDESNSTATFNIVGGAANGCDSLVTLDLTIINVNTDVTLAGNTLSAVATNAMYQWLDCNNNNAEINGEQGATFSPDLSGNYAVEVTQNGCADVSICTQVSLADIEELSKAGFLIHPNPSKGFFTVSWSETENKTIRVLNALGQEIRTVHTYGVQMNLNIKLLSGIYFIELSGENQPALRQRIIIE